MVISVVYMKLCPSKFCIPYSGETFEGENFHRSVRSDHFREKTFCEILESIIGGTACQKFCEETLMAGSKTVKSTNVSPLKVFRYTV